MPNRSSDYDKPRHLQRWAHVQRQCHQQLLLDLKQQTQGGIGFTPKHLILTKITSPGALRVPENAEFHAASAVRETIKTLISNEMSNKPLSDDKLAGILNKEGMDIARRTVAKYRDMLNIPSSSQRRRQARLQA